MSHQVLLYHIIFRTKGSVLALDERQELKLYAYINGLCINKGCKLYRVGGMPDHIHMLVSIPTKYSLSEFMKVLKVETNKWIKESNLFPLFTGWGRGYAVFTYSMSEKQTVFNYIVNQKNHHKHISFTNEFHDTLKSFGINPDDDDFFED